MSVPGTIDSNSNSSLFLSLPDDVFAMVSRFLLPRDVCSLSLCCRSLYALAACEKVWLTQCDMVGIVPHKDLVDWRTGVSSYKAICRFLLNIKPLIGIWVHQNPELGNLVYVMPGFVSVVGCRIIPQELGPMGIHDGPILWAPVFEIIGDFDGSPTFFLHGREKGLDYICHGSFKSINKSCNVLLLEVEPREKCIGNRENSRLQGVVGNNNKAMVPFGRLSLSDRKKLLEFTTRHVRQLVPNMAMGPLFPRLRDGYENFQKELVLLRGRREILSQMYRLDHSQVHNIENSEEAVGPKQLEQDDRRKSIECSRALTILLDGEGSDTQYNKRKNGVKFWGSLKQMLGGSSSNNGRHEKKHVRLEEFLGSNDTIMLTLKASTVKLSAYRAWPNMPESWFALYKMPLQDPTEDQVYAGLWGGTFGWPPGKPSEDKPGKALFFLLLSYEESHGQQLLIATKILEGTHYVLHPNGSAMFIVNINEPSSEPFPWNSDADSYPINIKHSFTGEGIANGYGFRYPGSKPGSLFEFQDGVLAFIWKDSRSVLTLQRLNLQQLLKKGERVPCLPPITNFSCLTKSYSNVFTGFPDAYTSSSSPRLP
ncbi:hypothetical protein HN51_036898 [Arachis hypogaea]|uniref:F-box domain-containing protein n=2 Tax=Arachis TaxID=3817 RepID=A0A444ZYC8_ARAHY|nr:hypothetical protein Ahy_B03g063739 [Arachis hypogaea]